jgi:hypothetical protein
LKTKDRIRGLAGYPGMCMKNKQLIDGILEC